MRTTIEILTQRRSIRRYERDAIPADNMNSIYEAIRNTPTSYNGQQFSVIDVTDRHLKETLYELTNQKQIKTCNHFLIFCADYNKIRTGAEAKGIEMPDFPKTVDGLLVGVIDATLAMMSAVAAAESLGHGTCCIGYARTAAPSQFSQLLNLPPDVFVVCGLAIGIPREQPDLKPKQPTALVIHSNKYDNKNIEKEILHYDETISEYNRTRSGTKTDNDWVGHIVSYYREAMSYDMLEAIRRQGFDVKK